MKSENARKLKTVSECFYAHNGRLIDKWASYLPIYQHHFAKFIGTAVRVLEIGVNHGGSLQLWREYFGPKSYITGVDIDSRCSAYEEPGIEILIADQSNLKAMGDIGDTVGLFDIVIDDGSHVKAHQEASFLALWRYLNPGGIYLIEDCHDGYPALEVQMGTTQLDYLMYQYPWVAVIEKPKRLIRGTPSRELREDEIEAINLYSHV